MFDNKNQTSTAHHVMHPALTYSTIHTSALCIYCTNSFNSHYHHHQQPPLLFSFPHMPSPLSQLNIMVCQAILNEVTHLLNLSLEQVSVVTQCASCNLKKSSLSMMYQPNVPGDQSTEINPSPFELLHSFVHIIGQLFKTNNWK
jgi:hypothetical protein